VLGKDYMGASVTLYLCTSGLFDRLIAVPPCRVLKKPSLTSCGMHEEVGSDIPMFHNYSISQDQPMKETLVVLVP